jgi:hypothetical protein
LQATWATPLDCSGYFSFDADQRDKIIAEATPLKLQWNAKENCYTDLEGKFLPPAKRVHYQREIWRPKVPGYELEFVLERCGPHETHLLYRGTIEAGIVRPQVTIQAVDIAKPTEMLAQLTIEAAPSNNNTYGIAGSTGFTSPEGTKVQLVLVTEEGEQRSPIYKP